MSLSDRKQKEPADSTVKWVVTVFILAGLLLIVISVALPHEGIWTYFKDFLKELGIVVLSVFAISLIYERTVAEKYLDYFLSRLRLQVEEGESNAATCAHLGIIRIFSTRDVFEMTYPLAQLVAGLTGESQLRVVARSIFLLVTKADMIQKAISQGAQVELCLIDPSSPPEEIAKAPDVELGDIHSVVSTFRKQIANWVETTKPRGKVEVRFHQIPFIDSFTSISSANHHFIAWDISFGRAITSKNLSLNLSLLDNAGWREMPDEQSQREPLHRCRELGIVG